MIAGGARVASLPVAIIPGWFATRTAADIHTATQLTLTDMHKGVSESQQRLGEILARMDDCQEQMDRHWREAFERMDCAAEQRAEVLKALLERRG